MIPYGRQLVDEDDVAAVVEALRSDWLTTGPMVDAFEQELAEYLGVPHAVAVSSGTAALHAAVHAAGVKPGDEVIIPAMTFVASANAVAFEGAAPIFADVSPDTLLVDPHDVEAKITPRTVAVMAVDYAGQPCDYQRLRALCRDRRLMLLADACHALGAEYRGCRTGALADLTTFSFHPVKHITTGEGGLVATADPELAAGVRRFRHHGLRLDPHERARQVVLYAEMVDLGYNYRITDIQCALGRSQLRHLPAWIARRREIADTYDRAFAGSVLVRPLRAGADVRHVYHLYVVRLALSRLRADRSGIAAALRAQGIGVAVHYLPVHLHPYYQTRFGTRRGMCPAAEAAFEEILSLPIYPAMTDRDVASVVATVEQTVERYAA